MTETDRMIKGLKAARSSGEIPDKLVARYRTLFANAAGLEILTDMLVTLGLFSEIKHESDVYLYNYAIELLTRTGVLKHDPKKLVRALLNVTDN